MTTSETYHPLQDSVERSIRDLKKAMDMLLDRTRAGLRAWFKAMEYTAYMSKMLARKTNRWKMLWEIAMVETPDISACLGFTFWLKVL